MPLMWKRRFDHQGLKKKKVEIGDYISHTRGYSTNIWKRKMSLFKGKQVVYSSQPPANVSVKWHKMNNMTVDRSRLVAYHIFFSKILKKVLLDTPNPICPTRKIC